MSAARGSQNFDVRLSLDGADAVETGLRRVQATAAATGQAVASAGDATGRALAVIERGTQAASLGLQKLGGDFAALGPLVEGAGGAAGRLVAALGSGAGLLGVMGAVGGAVTAAVAVYQNWDAVTRAVAGATDLLTGRVRAVRSELDATYALLNRILGLVPQAQSVAAQGVMSQIDEQANPIRARVAENERRLALAQQGGTTGRVIARGGASGLVPTDAFGQAADRAVQDRLRARNAADTEEIQRALRADRAALAELEAQRHRQQGIVVAAEENVGSVTRPPADTPATDRPRGGGGGGSGGGRAAQTANDALRDRDALIQRNITAEERYAQGLSRIADLNDRLIAQGNDPLPDEQVQREATRLMEDYERATQRAADGTRTLSDGTKALERAGQGVAKALSGAFEDLVFEGKTFDDVLKDLERSLLRLGNQYLLQPLFQQSFSALFGGGGGTGGQGGAGGGGGGGWIGGLMQGVGSLLGGGGAGFSAAGASEIVSVGAGLAKSLVFHDGGIVGAAGGRARLVPAEMFADAPRYHSGGIIGPDERPIIAQVGERVLNRREAADYARGGGGTAVTVNINGVKDPNAFRQSEGQVTAAIARAIGRSSRNR